jgi:glucose-6-phosphate isomerase
MASSWPISSARSTRRARCFIVCSKTFTTQETLANAQLARNWIAERLDEGAVPRHFAAVSTNAKAMDAFGIGADARFTMWDWVGGRYSMWSAIGLSLELAIGTAQFEEFLAGGHAMDEHFPHAPWRDNLPVLLGLVAVWNRNFMDCASHAVLPYTQRLARFPGLPAAARDGEPGQAGHPRGPRVDCATGPAIWGEPGSNAQHSFFQLLHQGSGGVSIDLLLPAQAGSDFAQQQDLVIANCLAQAQAFMAGYDEEDVRASSRPRASALRRAPRCSRTSCIRAAGRSRCSPSSASTRARWACWWRCMSTRSTCRP